MQLLCVSSLIRCTFDVGYYNKISKVTRNVYKAFRVTLVLYELAQTFDIMKEHF